MRNVLETAIQIIMFPVLFIAVLFAIGALFLTGGFDDEERRSDYT